MVQLETAMRTLTMDPGKFDSLVTHLVDDIMKFLDQDGPCNQILNAIIQQVIIIYFLYAFDFLVIKRKPC